MMPKHAKNLVSLDPNSFVDVYRCTKRGFEWCVGGWESMTCVPLAVARTLCTENPDYEVWQCSISDNPWSVWNLFEHFPRQFIAEVCSCSIDGDRSHQTPQLAD